MTLRHLVAMRIDNSMRPRFDQEVLLLLAFCVIVFLSHEGYLQGDEPVRPRLQIINGTSQIMEIFWLKTPMERIPNGLVRPDESQEIQTTIGHQFLLVGKDDRREWRVTCELPIQAFRATHPNPQGIPDFYTQIRFAQGFPIVASAKVNPYALKEAEYLINLMLAKRPDVREAMVKSGARLCILGHNEFTTDLPEFARLAKGSTPAAEMQLVSAKDYWDARARGTGGSQSDPFCSVGEENLLCFDGDPYPTESILIHEFAHNIHLRGMLNVDSTFDSRLRVAFTRAMNSGLWKGKYASVNHHEYFAEGVQSWFDNNRENDHDHNHVNTRAELIEYHPVLAAICREVFGDTELRYTHPNTRLHDHLRGYIPDQSPRFCWPAHLNLVKEQIYRHAQAREQAARNDLSTRPNIVVILCEDWSGIEPGSGGHPQAKYPVLNRLIREGVCFTNAFASSSLSLPSTNALATGRYHWQLIPSMTVSNTNSPNFVTYTDLLERRGVISGCSQHLEPAETFVGHSTFGKEYRSIDDFLANCNSKDPFCYLHRISVTRRPYELGEGQRAGLDPARVILPPHLPNRTAVRADFCDYLHRTQTLDSKIGEVVDSLQRAGKLDQSLLVVTATNGMPFPGAKSTLHTAGTRVPLIFRWPDKIPGGRTIEDLVSLIDIAPTILQATGIDPEESISGRSLLPVLTSSRSGKTDIARTHVLSGLDNEKPAAARRAIRTINRLYIQTTDPHKLASVPTPSRVSPPEIETDDFVARAEPSPTRDELLKNSNAPELKQYAILVSDLQPAEEFYDLRLDPAERQNQFDHPKHQSESIRYRELLDSKRLSASDPFMKTAGYRHYIRHGWTILAEERLVIQDEHRVHQALTEIEKQLQTIIRQIPPQAVTQLRTVPLWISQEYPQTPPRAEYHPGGQWLRDNHRNPGMACGIEFTNLRIIDSEARRMPWFVFHELAHAYHDQVYGFQNNRIILAHSRAQSNGKYALVEQRLGDGRTRKGRSYAISNPMEFFAESSEAYFGVNDLFPFQRTELIDYDPETADLIKELWSTIPSPN